MPRTGWRRAKWDKFSRQMLWMGEKLVRFADGIIVEELRSYFKKTYSRDTVYIPNAPVRTSANFSYGTSRLKAGRYVLF